jgi:hypothetical protein
VRSVVEKNEQEYERARDQFLAQMRVASSRILTGCGKNQGAGQDARDQLLGPDIIQMRPDFALFAGRLPRIARLRAAESCAQLDTK